MTRARDLADSADKDIAGTLTLDSLTTSGDVGIGTAPTRGRLHIFDDNSDIDMNSTADGQLHIDGNGFGFGIALNSAGAQLYTNSGARDLVFGVNETEVARLSPEGLGIGMIPNQKLDINGTSGLSIRFYRDAGFEAGIQLATTAGNMIATSVIDDLAIRSQSNMLFATGGNTERVRFKSGGGVQIKQAAQIQFTPTNDANFYSGVGFENASSSHAYSIGYGQGGVLAFNHFDNSSTYTRIATLSSAGLLELQGDLKVQSGNGISFAPTGSGSGSSSVGELLDDYEEGNWTPTAVQGIGGFTIQQANYTKVGRMVTVMFYISSITGKNSNQIHLGGLPYTPKGSHYSIGGCESNTTGDIGICRTNSSNTYLVFFKPDSNNHRSNFSGNDIGTSHLLGSITYQTA